jgi:hypothetical protein
LARTKRRCYAYSGVCCGWVFEFLAYVAGRGRWPERFLLQMRPICCMVVHSSDTSAGDLPSAFEVPGANHFRRTVGVGHHCACVYLVTSHDTSCPRMG